ncbi:hypothetical protein NM211_003646 [Vibrio cholerae]|nr:hypothetical protein [Vibrio cholerae]EMC2458455.1 hypothetical protein [Vibrio cholerae]
MALDVCLFDVFA